MKHISVLVFLFVSLNSQAGELFESLKQKFEAIKSSPTQVVPVNPVPSDRIDSWGTPNAEVTPIPSGDERFIDERFSSSRSSVYSSTRTVPSAKTSPSVKKSKIRTKDFDDAPHVARSTHPVATVSCTNPSRTWEGANELAKRGNLDRAYAAYMGLFQTCNSIKELKGTAYHALSSLPDEYSDQLMAEPIFASPKFKEIYVYMASNRMISANNANDSDTALVYSRAIRTDLASLKEVAPFEVSGWLELNDSKFKEAEKLFRAGLKIDSSNESMREGLVLSLVALNKLNGAVIEANKLEGESSEFMQGSVKMAQARASLKNKEFKQTLAFLSEAKALGIEEDDAYNETKAWALLGAGESDKAANLFGALSEDNPSKATFKQGLTSSLIQANNVTELKKIAKSDDPQAGVARQAVATSLLAKGRRKEAAAWSNAPIEGFESSISGLLSVRSKSGRAGEGKLSEKVVPAFRGKYNLNPDTSIEGQVISRTVSDAIRSDSGIETSLKLTSVLSKDSEGSLAVGTSSAGNKSAFTYQAAIKLFGDKSTVTLGSSRAPIVESVRSYAGSRDANGILAGRVLRTDLNANGSFEVTSDLKAGWSVAVGRATGDKVDDNSFIEGRASLLKDFSHPDWSWLSVGPEVRFAAWSRDQNLFTAGNGGYWSPESNIEVGARGNALSKEGETSLFKSTGFLGYADRTLSYGNTSGMVFEADATGTFLISPFLLGVVGGNYRTSPGYSDYKVFTGLVIPFERRTGLFNSDSSDFGF